MPTLSHSAQLKLLRIIGLCEGISFLLLLFIAVPLRYGAGQPGLVHLLGPIHGGLFLLYVGALVLAGPALKWNFGLLFGGLMAAVFPFGPFVFEAAVRRRVAESQA